MVELDKNTYSFTIKDFLRLVVLAVLLIIWVFVWIFYGTPIHDFNLWVLKQSFAHTNIEHPGDSILLEKKSYLGGQYTHGNSNCVYAVGEMRQSSLTKDEIRNVYNNTFTNSAIKRLPLYLIFKDEMDGPYELPFVVWQDEIWKVPQSTSKFYIVYASTMFPSLYDMRCDDLGPYSY